jgi:hypothetical protein
MGKKASRKKTVTPPPSTIPRDQLRKQQEEMRKQQDELWKQAQPYNAPPVANNVVNAAVHLQHALNAVPHPLRGVWHQISDALEDVAQQHQHVLVHYSLVGRVQGNGAIAWPGQWPPRPIPLELIDALEKSEKRLTRYVDQFVARATSDPNPAIIPLRNVSATIAHLAEQIRDWFPVAPLPTSKGTAEKKPGLRPTYEERKKRLLVVINKLGTGSDGNHKSVKAIIAELKRSKFPQRQPTTRTILRELKSEGRYNNPAI